MQAVPNEHGPVLTVRLWLVVVPVAGARTVVGVVSCTASNNVVAVVVGIVVVDNGIPLSMPLMIVPFCSYRRFDWERGGRGLNM